MTTVRLLAGCGKNEVLKEVQIERSEPGGVGTVGTPKTRVFLGRGGASLPGMSGLAGMLKLFSASR
jgi:hypothetical protein